MLRSDFGLGVLVFLQGFPVPEPAMRVGSTPSVGFGTRIQSVYPRLMDTFNATPVFTDNDGYPGVTTEPMVDLVAMSDTDLKALGAELSQPKS